MVFFDSNPSYKYLASSENTQYPAGIWVYLKNFSREAVNSTYIPTDYGNGVYFFAKSNDDYGNALSAWRYNHPEIELIDASGDPAYVGSWVHFNKSARTGKPKLFVKA
jgi:hypothetical protein